LYARGLITLGRNKKGYVVRADVVHLSQTAGNEPARQAPLTQPVPPTRYSFRDHAIEQRPWDLKRLHVARTGIHYTSPSVLPHLVRVVTDCLYEPKYSYSSNAELLAKIARRGTLMGSLFLLLGYAPPENGHQPAPLVLGRIDHQPMVQRAALFASDQARKREDAESRTLVEVLDALLTAD
jgi:hypothetical protein